MRRTSLSGRTYIRSIIGDGEVDDKAIWMVGKGILQAVKVGMLIKTGSVRDLQQMAPFGIKLQTHMSLKYLYNCCFGPSAS